MSNHVQLMTTAPSVFVQLQRHAAHESMRMGWPRPQPATALQGTVFVFADSLEDGGYFDSHFGS